jgi:hypothetical protein
LKLCGGHEDHNHPGRWGYQSGHEWRQMPTSALQSGNWYTVVREINPPISYH